MVAPTNATAAARAGQLHPRLDAIALMRSANASPAITPGARGDRRRCCIPASLRGRPGLVTLSDAEIRIETTAGPLPRQFLEPLLRAHPVPVGHTTPAPVRTELPRVGLVGEDEVQHFEEPGLELGILHRDHDLNAAVEVAAHEVRRTDEDLQRQTGSGRRVDGDAAEAVDPRMLEEAAHNGT